MSTFLQLCQRLRQETVDSGSGPTSVVSQTGDAGRLVKWIADAYAELQTEKDAWLWLRSSFSVNTVAGTDSYAYTDCTDDVSAATVARFAFWYWLRDRSGTPYFSAYLTSSGSGAEFHLVPLEWDRFRRLYKFGSQTNNQPAHVSVDPATQKFVLGPVPDDIYTVRGSYQKGPQILAANSDTPEMPSRFHDLIVYDAMAKYGGNRVAPEAMVRALSEGSTLRGALMRDQLPKIGFGGPLA